VLDGEEGGAVGVADAAPVGEAESIASLDAEDGPAVDGADIVAAVRPCGFALMTSVSSFCAIKAGKKANRAGDGTYFRS
jgi:hypothetical protein